MGDRSFIYQVADGIQEWMLGIYRRDIPLCIIRQNKVRSLFITPIDCQSGLGYTLTNSKSIQPV
jgi:hypothetical protein